MAERNENEEDSRPFSPLLRKWLETQQPQPALKKEKQLKRRYMPGLDGLRAFAVLGVILYHLGLPWIGGGLLGVSLFFVLSGYLITDLLCFEHERSGTIDLKTFWLHRVRRLFPAMATAVVALFIWTGLFAPQLFVTLKNDAVAALFYVSNWWYIFHHLSYFADNAHPSLLTHFWSLAVEEQFYLIWPLVLLFVLRRPGAQRRLLHLAVAGAMLSALLMALLYQPGSDPSRVYYGTDTRAFSLLIGSALAFIWPSWRLSDHLKKLPVLILDLTGAAAVAILLLMMLRLQDYDAFVYRGGLLLFSIAGAVAIAAVASPCTRIGRFFSSGPLRWIGERSYAMYLWHYPIVFLINDNYAPMWAQVLLRILDLVLIFVISALSYTYIESPIRRGALSRAWSRMMAPGDGVQTFVKKRLTLVGLACALLFTLFVVVPKFTAWSTSRSVAQDRAETSALHVQQESESKPARKTSAHTKAREAVPKGNAMDQLKDVTISQPITVIGDSILIDTEPYIQKVMPNAAISAKIGRHLQDVPPLIRQLRISGKLKPTVILELGTNGPFTEHELGAVLDELGSRKVILVNVRVPRSWQYSVNQVLRQAAGRYKHVKLADWYTASQNHSSYFAYDGIHLNPFGAVALTNLLIDTIGDK